jgi:hypothetical protein
MDPTSVSVLIETRRIGSYTKHEDRKRDIPCMCLFYLLYAKNVQYGILITEK